MIRPKAVEYKPGDPITWHHFFPDGRVIIRTGVVLDRAPVINAEKVAGTDRPAQLMNWWVKPDEPLPTDLYKIIAVGKAGARSVEVHGKHLPGVWGDQYIGKGKIFSSNYAGSPLGGLAAQAVQKIHEWKKDR
jgi:hypothetical protein